MPSPFPLNNPSGGAVRHLIAATATDPGGHMPGWVLIAAALALWAAWYPISLTIWPLKDCRRCKGAGHHRPDGNRKLARPCRRCKGRGKRIRWGRRVRNYFAGVAKDAR